MRIVLFNWRDMAHPRAGGAELYTHQALSALANRGHECVWFSSRAPGLPHEETAAGYTIVRFGTELTCRFHAYRWLADRSDYFDVVIDEVNTLPWFSPLIEKRRTMLLIHQLAREVWWAETPLPVAAAGYLSEPLYLQLYRSCDAITVSESSAESLREVGLRGHIHVVENGLRPPFDVAGQPSPGLIGYVGRITPSKRIGDIVRAVAIVREADPRVRLLVIGAGADREVAKLHRLCERLGIDQAVEFTGRISNEDRDRRLREVDVLALASRREGWGLVVSEAARWGIPSVGYPVPGLRDSIVNERTGLLTREQTPHALADALAQLVGDRERRASYGEAAAARLAGFSDDRFARRFCEVIESRG